MFQSEKVNHKDKEAIRLYTEQTQMLIYPHLGASVQELTLQGKKLIDNQVSDYSKNYASAVLFPFVNRIDGGEYQFEQQQFNLEINHPQEGHAIHGLVYGVTFEKTVLNLQEELASISFQYHYKGDQQGYPFSFKIMVTYILTHDTFKMEAEFINVGDAAMPCNFGWHPYFTLSDIQKSSVVANFTEKVMVGPNMIPVLKEGYHQSEIGLKDTVLDDCFVISDGVLFLNTPEQVLKFNFSENQKYVQLYTPPSRDQIAIEPMTGIADAFNNTIGLTILQPKEKQEIRTELRFGAKEK